MELVPVDSRNVTNLKLLNSAILPIHYSDKFYKSVVKDPTFSRLARIQGKYVGMVCCRKTECAKQKKNLVEGKNEGKEGDLGNSNEESRNEDYKLRNNSERMYDDELKNENESSLYIMTLGCSVLNRRRGIGSNLLRFALKLAADENCKTVQLHVQSSNNDAVEFYRHFGFEVIEEIQRYYRYLKPSSALLLEKCVTGTEGAVT